MYGQFLSSSLLLFCPLLLSVVSLAQSIRFVSFWSGSRILGEHWFQLKSLFCLNFFNLSNFILWQSFLLLFFMTEIMCRPSLIIGIFQLQINKFCSCKLSFFGGGQVQSFLFEGCLLIGWEKYSKWSLEDMREKEIEKVLKKNANTLFYFIGTDYKAFKFVGHICGKHLMPRNVNIVAQMLESLPDWICICKLLSGLFVLNMNL